MNKNKITSFVHKALKVETIQGVMYHCYDLSYSEMAAEDIVIY